MIAAGAARPAPAVPPAGGPASASRIRPVGEVHRRTRASRIRPSHRATSVASADGVRFTVPVQTLYASSNPRYFGLRHKGATWLNVVNDQAMALGELVGLR